jgi:membrane protein YqaA with SNARE-associated domain
MPYWLGAGLWLATVATVAGISLVAAACGWVLGYAHRSLIAWGMTRAALARREQQRRHRLEARRRVLVPGRDPLGQGQHRRGYPQQL